MVGIKTCEVLCSGCWVKCSNYRRDRKAELSALVGNWKSNPVDALRDVATQMYPGYKVDEASFAEYKAALDATLEGLDPLGGPLQPEVSNEPERQD